jgi:diguanylate cyclase (GGDEF)-like protein
VTYLVGYLALASGLLLLIRRRCPGGDLAGLLDAGIVTTGVGVLAWVALVDPVAEDASLGPAARALAAAYPLADLLLLGLLVRLAFSPSRSAGASRLLGLGVLAWVAGDVGYAAEVLAGSSIGTDLVNVLWLVGYALATAAVLHPEAVELDEPTPGEVTELDPLRLAALTSAAVMGPVVLLVESVAGTDIDGPVIAIGSIVLFGLVVARMAGLFRRVQAQANELAALAGTDSLTGVANRRRWDDTLPVELAQATRSGEPLCVAIVDLDHFKAYNDRHGHQAGDELLRSAARTWRAGLRGTDLLARYGGEEFAVLLPGCELDEAMTVARRLHAGIPDEQTCSIGLVRWDGREGAEALVGRADLALYQAKSDGRDRTRVGRPGAPGPGGQTTGHPDLALTGAG